MARRKKKKKVRKKKGSFSSLIAGITWQQVLGWGLLILSLGLIAYFRSQLIDIPFDRDEGTYYTLGKMIADGATPYSVAYEMKPPGLLYLYALIWMVFGGTIAGLHWGLFTFTLASMGLLFFWARYLMDDISAAISAFAFGLFNYAPRMSGYAGVSEHFVVFFILAGFLLLFLAMKKEQMLLYFLSGLLFAAGISIKQNGIFFAGLGLITPVLFHGIQHGRWTKRSTYMPVLWFAGGGLSLGLLFTIILLVQGALGDFWYWNFTYAGEVYTAAIPFDQGVEFFKSYFTTLSKFNTFLWIGGGLGLIAVWFNTSKLFEATFLSLLFLVSFASIVPGLRFYGHYWLFIGPAAGLLFGSLIHVVPRLLRQTIQPVYSRITLVLLVALLTGLHVSQNEGYYTAPREPVILRQTYGDNPFFEMHKLGEWLNDRMHPKASIVVFGSEAQTYVQTQKDPPSRHIFLSFLAKNHPRKEQFIQEFKTDVENENPGVALFVNHPYSWSITSKDDQQIYRWCYQYFQENYKVIALAEIFPNRASNFDFTGEKTEADSRKYVLVGLRNDMAERQLPSN